MATKGWDIHKAVKELISKSSGFDLKEIRVHMRLEEDLGMDSLDRHELALMVWAKFELEEDIPPDELRTITTVKGMIETIKKYTLSI